MSTPVDAQIVALAARRNRIVTHEQLIALGLGRAAISYRARHGRLHRAFQGVFAVGTPAVTPVERATAAVLACGAGAALSHTSALWLWQRKGSWREPIHVTAPRERRRPGIVVHRSSTLTRADVRFQLGVRITSAARTLLDCAPALAPEALARAIDDVRIAGHVSVNALEELVRRLPRHPGAAAIAAHIGLHQGPTRSRLERAFLQLCERYGLPQPEVNVPVAGFEADAWFAAERVVVELDAWGTHQGRRSFHGDRERDAARLEAGIVTYRITWDRLMHSPEPEARRLKAILVSRGSRPAQRSAPDP